MQGITENPIHPLLRTAQDEALKSRQYNSEETRATIVKEFTEVFDGKQPYGWQVDTCEALLLGLDCIVIAGTGAGKTFLFAMPLLMDTTCRKMVLVISPLNALEYDQVG
jgi:ATP-dependent helicase YprA (DUF1998 family)